MTALFRKTKSTELKPTGAVKAAVEDISVVHPVAARKGASGSVRPVLRSPRVTEKATMLGKHNTYVFEVDPGANKIEIARAVSAQYQVHPTKVRIVNRAGKSVRWGKSNGARSGLKKAMVTLPQGEKISLYEGV